MRPAEKSPTPSILSLPPPAAPTPKKPPPMGQESLEFEAPLPTSPHTPAEKATAFRPQRRKDHPHEYVYCHDKKCLLQFSIHCICDKKCTAGAAILREVWLTRISVETLPGRQVPIAFNPTVSSIQTETPYLSQNQRVEDPASKRDTSPGGKSIKKTALQLGKQAWSTFHNKIIPLMAGTYLMPGVEQFKGKGVDRTYRTRNPSTVAMYEKSRTSTSLDQGIPEKAKQQWVEDISANFKERKFSFGLPVMEDIPVIEGIAIEPIEYYKKDMSVKGNPDPPEASDVMVRDFAEIDHAVQRNGHVQLELVEDGDDIEEFDRVEQSQDYMAGRAADKAKRGEMMNKLPTVLEQREVADNENIPLTSVLPKSLKSPLSRSPVAKLPLGTNHHHKTKGPLAIRNPGSQRKSVERDVHLSVPSDHSSQPGLRKWSQATTIVGSEEGVALDFDKPERKEIDIKVCEQPARTSNWLKNVPLSKSWKLKRQTTQQQKYGTYVDPFQEYVDARSESKDGKDVKTRKDTLRNSLRDWIPFQHKKQEVDSDGFWYEGSSEESPIRGRPRQKVQRPLEMV